MYDLAEGERELAKVCNLHTTVETLPQQSQLTELMALSVTGRIAEMEANLRNERFIFPEMALSGQITLFYSAPNTGKTLFFMRFLIDAIKNCQINGKDVFYINADDNYRGLLTKAKLAENNDMVMISPAEASIPPKKVLALLDGMARENSVNGKIIILDTLKKFANMMDKKSQSDLYEILRRIVAKGGTVIIAGHANKHKDINGELVYEGTSDTLNDVDCAYAINRISDIQDEKQVIEFICKKDRGAVTPRVSYKYTKRQGLSYIEMLKSISLINPDEADTAIEARKHTALLCQYDTEVQLIKNVLENGAQNQTTIINQITKDKNLSGETTGRRLTTALKELTGIAWTVSKGEKNATIFCLDSPAAAEYRNARDGY